MAHQPGPLSSQAALAPKGDLVLKGFTIPKSSREKFKENGFIFCDASYKGITDSKIDVVARVINKKKIWKYKRFVMRELYNWSIVKDYAKRAGESENNNQCLNFLEAIQTYENLYLFYEKPKELDWTKQGTKGNSRLEEIFYNLCSHFMRLKVIYCFIN